MSRKTQNFIAEKPTLTKTFTTAKGGTFTSKLYRVDTEFSLNTQLVIWNHGKSNYNIWFLNRENKLCRVKSAEMYKGNIYLTVTIDCKEGGKQTNTKMSVDRFLYLYEKGEFKITFKKFVDTYLIPKEVIC